MRAALVVISTLSVLAALGAARAQVLLGSTAQGSPTNGLLGSVSTADGSWTTIGDPTTDGGLTGLAIDAAGDLFGTNDNNGEGDVLIVIDKSTGELLATIGTITDTGDNSGVHMSDISFRHATDELYGLCLSPGKQGNLYRIDTTTADATLVGSTGLSEGGLAFGPDDTLWLSAFNGEQVLAKIDPDTAAVIGTPVDAFGCDAIAVRDDGVIFGKEFDGSDLLTIDPSDGSESLVGFIDAPDGDAEGLVFLPAPTFTSVASYFLPRSVKVKLNAKHPEKSQLVATGFFDLGPDPVDLTQTATLDVGGYEVKALSLTPNKKSTVFKLKQPGLQFTIKPDKSGSSRALFTIKVKDDLDGLVDPDAVLALHFVIGAVDVQGAVTLEKGKYTLGKKRGALVSPAIYLYKVANKLKGGGADALSLKAGMSTSGTTPATAPSLALDFGENFTAAVPGSDFKKKGDRFTFKGPPGGLTSVVLDYLRETFNMKGKGVDLGAFADGPQAVTVTIGLGTDVREVSVRMVKKGKSLKY
jgi:hypothetical protein